MQVFKLRIQQLHSCKKFQNNSNLTFLNANKQSDLWDNTGSL